MKGGKIWQGKDDCQISLERYVRHSSQFEVEPKLKEDSTSKVSKEEQKESKSTWSGLYKKMSTLFPYLWPKEKPGLQVRVVVCVLLLLALRGINVLVPRLNKKIIDGLAAEKPEFSYDTILLFALVSLLQGGVGRQSGLVTNLKSILWIRVQQFTIKEMRTSLFNHLHGLGVRWHNGRKTGEVLRVMDRGTTSITTLLNALFFQILPIAMDVFVAMAALSIDLNFYFGLIIFGTMLIYLVIAIIGTEYRTKFKRKMNTADNEQRTRSVDSLLNSETVKMYGNEEHEGKMFSDYMDKYQGKEWLSISTMYGFNLLQNVVLNFGVLTGSLYCAFLISEGKLTVGDYILFGTYMAQLMGPLNQLAALYRNIQEAMINTENMLELMNEEAEIKDKPKALAFKPPPEGVDVNFENVSFHYDPRQPILKNVSFTVPAGKTLAIVGQSGSGKSTIVKLLLRFYDPESGRVVIGGQDIKTVTQSSLRSSIGVVPQDTVLFNESINFNISYGRVGADQDDVEKVAALADIHSKIVSLPDGYETKVGERGLKISGGEKQRVAIARTLLRSPQLLLLDEATSALDTATERNIQETLQEVCQNRTCVIVAHRLSTVVHAEQILVMSKGEVAECGTHKDLVAAGGIYADMWSQQASGEDVHKPGT